MPGKTETRRKDRKEVPRSSTWFETRTTPSVGMQGRSYLQPCQSARLRRHWERVRLANSPATESTPFLKLKRAKLNVEKGLDATGTQQFLASSAHERQMQSRSSVVETKRTSTYGTARAGRQIEH